MMNEENKWAGLDKGQGYRVVNFGRPAVFLIPSHKLQTLADGVKVQDRLHGFLTERFGAFTTTTVPYFGYWRSESGQTHYDECRQYEVAFEGKYRIPELLTELAQVARLIGEECLYVKAGQYAALLYPEPVE